MSKRQRIEHGRNNALSAPLLRLQFSFLWLNEEASCRRVCRAWKAASAEQNAEHRQAIEELATDWPLVTRFVFKAPRQHLHRAWEVATGTPAEPILRLSRLRKLVRRLCQQTHCRPVVIHELTALRAGEICDVLTKKAIIERLLVQFRHGTVKSFLSSRPLGELRGVLRTYLADADNETLVRFIRKTEPHANLDRYHDDYTRRAKQTIEQNTEMLARMLDCVCVGAVIKIYKCRRIISRVKTIV